MNRYGFIAVLISALVLANTLLSATKDNLASATAVPSCLVRLGIDNIDDNLRVFNGRRVGLITNATGINSQFESSVDVLSRKTTLVTLFSPEHGLRGAAPAGDSVNSQTDAKTGLPVYSLYGDTRKPTPDMLANVDVLAFDIQDVGARPYTYIYTMAYAMQAAKDKGITFVVFDRPNPIGGVEVEGGVLKSGYESFVGLYPIPIRHGMTVGELATLLNKEYGIGCDLVVIKMTGWKRDMYFTDTGLPWVMTSPNIPTPDTAIVYPGTGILGDTNVSVGVGTTRPFELVGAPWLDADQLATQMNNLNLPGVIFRPAYFQPKFGCFAGSICNGVQLHIIDKKAFRPVRTAITMLYVIKEQGGDNFAFQTSGSSREMIDLVSGDDSLRSERYSLEELLAQWDKEAVAFKEMSKTYYLYPADR